MIGFDDVPLARMVEPALTTIAQPVAEMGTWAVERIVAALTSTSGGPDGNGPVEVRMPCRLVVRESTAPPPEV